jgi:methyl-accepting chemotaxis protein
LRLTVGKKLVGGFLIVAVLALLMGVFAIMQLQKVNNSAVKLGENWLPAAATAATLKANATDAQRVLLRHILEHDPATRAKLEADFSKFVSAYAENAERYRKTITADATEDRTKFEALQRAYAKYQDSLNALLALSQADRREEANRYLREVTFPLFVETNQQVEALVAFNVDSGRAASVQAASNFRLALGVTLAVIAAVFVIALAIGLVISRQITAGLAQVVKAANGLAQGDLNQSVQVNSNDELGDMARSFQEMIVNLRHIVGQVRLAASTVAAGSEQISSSAEQLAKSAQSQAAAVEETSSSMEEMAASITQVSGNAHSLSAAVEQTSSSIEEMAASIQEVAGSTDTLGAAVSQTSASVEQLAASVQAVARNVTEANHVSEASAEVAEKGRQAVDQTIDGMTRINRAMSDVVTVIASLGKSSEEIGNIISVIDDIAEQTNLLALNAAIEAARAGEHGRGFAVVADEVRKLAERSAKATGEIATLIKGIQRETEQAVRSTQEGNSAIQQGTTLAQTAGDSLGAIVKSVGQVTVLMGQISQATGEQTRAAVQISDAVGSMNRLTHQVTAATREQAKGSEQIIQAVETMNRMTQQVAVATSEQKQGGDQVVMAVESINRSAQESTRATQMVSQAALDLQNQALVLTEAISFFKDGQIHDASRTLTGAVPQAPALMAARS